MLFQGGLVCPVPLDFLLYQEDLVFQDLRDYLKIQGLLFLPPVLLLQKLLFPLGVQVVPWVQVIRAFQNLLLPQKMLLELLI